MRRDDHVVGRDGAKCRMRAETVRSVGDGPAAFGEKGVFRWRLSIEVACDDCAVVTGGIGQKRLELAAAENL